ncbi:MAG: DUF2007 domain-containing protein [Chloroflexi bacterium]|nr:DUF2007 domain-containing protein [Chloroflexota bacterium]
MPEPTHELVSVYVAQGHLEAEVVRGRLESEGVPAMLSYESLGLVYGLTLDGLGQVHVRVPGAFAARARAILATPPDPGDADTETEPPST